VAAPETRERVAREIRSRLARACLPVDRVVLLPPKSLRSTASGKLMRLEARSRYLQGRLGVRTDGS
jgi:hypothetical protein